MNIKTYNKVKTLLNSVEDKKQIDGPFFISVYNEAFNTRATFSNCCPSENAIKLQRLKHAAKVFLSQNPEAAEIAKKQTPPDAPEIVEALKVEQETPTGEEKLAPPVKRGRGRPKKSKK